MKGDFSRFTFDRKKHYSAVRMQQGRVQLDADWNEQLDINLYRLAMQIRDLIGYSGVPEGEQAGFKITPDGSNLKIGAGRIYIAGELYENEETIAFDQQPDYPGAADELRSQPEDGNNVAYLPDKLDLPDKRPNLPEHGIDVTQPKNLDLPDGWSNLLEDGTYVAYLDVWQRHITALEDPAIVEVALGGADTATRVKNLWQVKLILENEENKDYGPGWHPEGPNPPPTGQIKATVQPGVTLENQLYRVEIHKSSDDISGPTFKWSRDNGAVAAKADNISDQTITISSAGHNSEIDFTAGQWIELRSEAQTLNGEPGTLYYLDEVQGNQLTVRINDNSKPFLPENPKSPLPYQINDDTTILPNDVTDQLWIVRRWDSQTGQEKRGDIDVSNTETLLDNKIIIEFRMPATPPIPRSKVKYKKIKYNTGDYWLIPTRTLSGTIEWPKNNIGSLFQPPHGIQHHYVPLALLQYEDGNWSLSTDVPDGDLRPTFKPLIANNTDTEQNDTATSDAQKKIQFGTNADRYPFYTNRQTTNIQFDFEVTTPPRPHLVPSIKIDEDQFGITITIDQPVTPNTRVIFHQCLQYDKDSSEFEVIHIDKITLRSNTIGIKSSNKITKNNFYVNFSLHEST